MRYLDLQRCTGLTTLGSNAFAGLANLISLNQSGCTGLPTLPPNVFAGLDNLKHLYTPF